MSILTPKTVEGVRKQKQRLMRRWTAEQNSKMAAIYEEAVNGCDRLTARIIAKGRRTLGLFLVLLVLLLLQGCHTISGVGKDLQDWSSAYVDDRE